jgi:Ca2+-binding RTX toxin-like protein
MVRHARAVLVLAAALAATGALAAQAAADATVGLSGGVLGVAVAPRDGADGNHGMIVEPFHEVASLGRDGFRVRQDTAGRPTFAQVTGCQHNPLFNDVVCTGPRGSVTVTGGDGDDVVVASGEPGGNERSTAARTIAVGGSSRSFQVPNNSGSGLTGVPVACLEGQAPFVGFTVDGGPGADFVGALAAAAICPAGFATEASLVPVLTVQGGAGADVIGGGPAADTLSGGSEDDVVAGNPGNDRLDGGDGNDVLLGNQGNDRVFGGGGADVLSGHEGADGLNGGSSNDDLAGGPGADALEGGDGNDVLRDRDGERDLVSCGAGVDFAEVDLQDPIRGCENVSRAPADDGLPAYASGRTLRAPRDGTVPVRVACPRQAKVRCRGSLELRRSAPLGKLLGRASYDVRLGTTAIVVVPIAGALPAAGRRVVALTSEQGASDIGLRSSVRLLLVR